MYILCTCIRTCIRIMNIELKSHQNDDLCVRNLKIIQVAKYRYNVQLIFIYIVHVSASFNCNPYFKTILLLQLYIKCSLMVWQYIHFQQFIVNNVIFYRSLSLGEISLLNVSQDLPTNSSCESLSNAGSYNSLPNRLQHDRRKLKRTISSGNTCGGLRENRTLYTRHQSEPRINAISYGLPLVPKETHLWQLTHLQNKL